jgi:hypothetical protein
MRPLLPELAGRRSRRAAFRQEGALAAEAARAHCRRSQRERFTVAEVVAVGCLPGGSLGIGYAVKLSTEVRRRGGCRPPRLPHTMK